MHIVRAIIVVQLLFITSNHILISLPKTPSTYTNLNSKKKIIEYFFQGENFKKKGEYEKSIELFTKALSLANLNKDIESEVESLIKLGTLYWNTGQLDKSVHLYEEALASIERTNKNDKKDEVLTYIQIYNLYLTGKEHRAQGRHQHSIENFDGAIALAQRIGSEEHEVKCLRQLSVTYAELNNFDKLFPLSKKALDIAQKLNHKKEKGRCLYNIGLYYDAINNYSQALLHYKEALKIARRIKDYYDESYCLTNISHIYIQLGNYDKALDYLREVLKIDRKLEEDEYIAKDLNNIGVIYQKRAIQSNTEEDLYNALDYFQESLQIARRIQDIKTEIQAMTNVGMIYIDMEEYPAALRYFNFGLEKAKKVQDNEEIANLYVNIGMVYSKQNDYDRTIEYCQRALEKASDIKDDAIRWEAYLELANAHMKNNCYQKSLKNYRKSVIHLEKIRSKIQLEELKVSYLGTDKRIDTYYNLIDLLVALKQSEPTSRYDIEAFHYMERAKARAFLDSLEVSQVNIGQSVDRKLLQNEDEFMDRISNLNAKLIRPGLSTAVREEIIGQLENLEEELESLKRKIRILSPAYANLRYPRIISLQQTQEQMLDDKTAFFEYCLRDKNSYAFVVTKRELKIFSLPSAKKIQAQVKEYLKAITDKESRDFSLGFNLYASLVLPGLDEKMEKLIIIPDDILHYLPFETLLTQKNEKRWLIQDYTIGYSPSISSLREIIQRERATDTKSQQHILALGDPFFGPDEYTKKTQEISQNFEKATTLDLPRLKYSGQEIDRIAALFKKTTVLKRKKATEGQFKRLELTDYKILHLATHCLIDDQKPARSSIVFSLENSSDEDGLLQMREIFHLKLNSDLVTLSSCQTGLGQLNKGEGIEGLSRAFFYAGASSALISLWAVNDQASSQFMERFYFHLRSSNSIMNSLQKAKLEMIGSDIAFHPYYWAGFVASGNSDKVIFPANRTKLMLLVLVFLSFGIGSFFILKKRFISSSTFSHGRRDSSSEPSDRSKTLATLN